MLVFDVLWYKARTEDTHYSQDTVYLYIFYNIFMIFKNQTSNILSKLKLFLSVIRKDALVKLKICDFFAVGTQTGLEYCIAV